MPASLLYEFEPQANFSKHHHHSSSLHHSSHHNGSNGAAAQLEDRRAFELALELSLLGLGTDNNNSSSSSNGLLNGHHHQQTHPLNPFESESRIGAKKSQNTTECVPVPSSEHVAEIVGRQGCKIKALRSKTNTYIKTPVRGEEPVFVVTGRKEDVGAAKREILSAAEHFSQIRAQRKNNPGSVGPAPNAHLPGHVTASVRVPYRVVGLVVGPKGATIKRIQQQTNTYIITPSREKD
ncbi:PREDICTED: RNA-binding protein MEX3B-like, partial [Rhagoletis zephyria]|uniref:RNA-binding protein MEX3B-like n=1 Tax=Rhagoletis zephyria TaxID=28612 RepID=UPI0008117C1D